MTTIEWTNQTWNPLVGCSKVSPGCQNCYAIMQSHRNAAIARSFAEKGKDLGRLQYYPGLTEKRGDRIEWTGVVRFVPEALEIPLRTKTPTIWFVNSMSDLFHEKVTDEQLDQIFAVMALTSHHTYQVLTKRPERMQSYLSKTTGKGNVLARVLHQAREIRSRFPSVPLASELGWVYPNIWLGITVENQKAANERIPLLLETPAAVRFLSVEPMLEKIDIWHIDNALYDGGMPFEWQRLKDDETRGIKWVICGGESGAKARPFNLDWARDLRDQCKNAAVPFFMKQTGSNCPEWKSSGKGGKIEELPEDLQIREMPDV